LALPPASLPRVNFGSPRAMKRILLVQTGFLGDLILSSAVLSELRVIFPESEIWMLTTPAGKGLVESHPALTGVIAFDKRGSRSSFRGLWRMASELRAMRFDEVYSLHKSFRTALLLWLAGIPIRFGFSEAKGRWLYTRTSPRCDLSHDVLRNLAILRNVGREPGECAGELSVGISSDAERECELMAGPRGAKHRLGIAPGSVWSTKRWTSAGFTQTARHFLASRYEVLIVGGKEDQSIGDEIASEAPGVRNLCGKLSLQGSAALVRSCDLFLSNDSAPLHLASAFKIPTAAVFCATVPEFGFGPWKNRAEVLGVEGLSCRPCGRHGGARCPTGTHACQLQLDSAQVIDSLERLSHG
jgi:heptosyltransferase II